jgi:hypothetical protein
MKNELNSYAAVLLDATALLGATNSEATSFGRDTVRKAMFRQQRFGALSLFSEPCFLHEALVKDLVVRFPGRFPESVQKGSCGPMRP